MIIEKLSMVGSHNYLYGTRSSIHLECVSIGYYIALHVQNVTLSDDEYKFLAFTKFINERYNFNNFRRWGQIIRLYSSSNNESIEKFNTLLSEFKSCQLAVEKKDSIDYITKCFQVNNRFDYILTVLNANKESFLLDSVCELVQVLVGYQLAMYGLKEKFNIKWDPAFEYFIENIAEFREYFGKRYELPFHLWNSDILLILSESYTKSVEDYIDCILSFLKTPIAGA